MSKGHISETKRGILDLLEPKFSSDRVLSPTLSWKWPSATLSPFFHRPDCQWASLAPKPCNGCCCDSLQLAVAANGQEQEEQDQYCGWNTSLALTPDCQWTNLTSKSLSMTVYFAAILFTLFMVAVAAVDSPHVDNNSGYSQVGLSFYIGPRYSWGSIYGSECLKLTNRPCWDLTDVTLADEDTN